MTDVLERAFDEFATVTEEQVLRLSAEVRALREQLHEIQTRAAPAGPPGPQGERGEPGPAGPPGESGPAGPAGTAGERGADGIHGREGPAGRDGIVGPAGERGAAGPQGERGSDGLQGREGQPGPDGASGQAGERGADGPPGERGADGVASVEEIEAIAARHVTDLQVRTMADWDRGVFVAGTKYARGELTTWDGATYLAMSDVTAQPGTSADWRRLVSKGRDGRDRDRK